MKLDPYDRKILHHLQHDGRLSHVKLAEMISLSPTAVHARITRLTKEGVIEGYRAHLSHRALGYGMLVFVEVLLDRTATKVFDEFRSAVATHDEILECHLITGGFDYLLKIRVGNMEDYRAFSGRVLWQLPGVRETRTYAVMEEVKHSHYLAV